MLIKFAAFAVTAAKIHRQGDRLMRTAHRHEFAYEPRPGFLYVRSRAISSRTNDNFDHFPAEEIKKAYRSFIGKPVFVNHHNDNHRRARGVVVDAALHEDFNPDGSPDTWTEVLMEVDALRFPKLAERIINREIDRTSMGTDVKFSVCSVCNNRATTPLEYCAHIPKMKGRKVRRTTASGTKEDVLCFERCYGLSFFENSLLVEEPADPTAFFLGEVDTRGLEMAGITSTASRKVEGEPSLDEKFSKFAKFATTHPSLPYSTDVSPVSPAADVPRWENYEGPHAGGDFQEGYRDAFQGITRPFASEDYFDGHDYAQEILAMGHGRAAVRQAKRGPEKGTPEYKKAYTRGWVSSSRTSGGALEAADARGEPDAWYDGYLDYAAARPKWTLMHYANEDAWINDGAPEGLPPSLSRASVTAINETKAPAQVDTLRDETCPICDEADAYDGETCMVCGYIRPPEDFLDPDVNKAQEIDLRQDKSEDSTTLKCDNCGHTEKPAKKSEPSDDEGDGPPWEKNAITLKRDRNPEDEPEVIQAQPKQQAAEDAQNVQKDDEQEDDASPDGSEELSAGDTCPECGEGTMQSLEEPSAEDDDNLFADEADPEANPDAEPDAEGDEEPAEEDPSIDAEPASEDDQDDEDEASEEDESDGEDKPPWLKKKKDARIRRAPNHRRRSTSMRPALAALAEQQKTIEKQARQIRSLQQGFRFITQVAGIENHPRVAAILKQADEANPAQPIPDPPSEPAAQTTQDALGEINPDQPAGGNLTNDPTVQGATTETDVAPDATTSLEDTGTVLDAPLNLNEQDPTRPVEGTEGPRPLDEVKTETEVRVGDPTNPQEANAETGWTNAKREQSKPVIGEARTIASLRLARLRLQSGIESGDDLVIGQKIAASDVADEAIQAEIATLAKVVTAAGNRPQRTVPRGLVPRAASGVQRTIPSLAPSAPASQPGFEVTAGGSAPSEDEFAFE